MLKTHKYPQKLFQHRPDVFLAQIFAHPLPFLWANFRRQISIPVNSQKTYIETILVLKGGSSGIPSTFLQGKYFLPIWLIAIFDAWIGFLYSNLWFFKYSHL